MICIGVTMPYILILQFAGTWHFRILCSFIQYLQQIFQTIFIFDLFHWEMFNILVLLNCFKLSYCACLRSQEQAAAVATISSKISLKILHSISSLFYAIFLNGLMVSFLISIGFIFVISASAVGFETCRYWKCTQKLTFSECNVTNKNQYHCHNICRDRDSCNVSAICAD